MSNEQKTDSVMRPLKVASRIFYGFENGLTKLFEIGEDFPAHLLPIERIEALLKEGDLKYAHDFAPASVQSELEQAQAALAEREAFIAEREAEIERLKNELTEANLREAAAKRGLPKSEHKAEHKEPAKHEPKSEPKKAA